MINTTVQTSIDVSYAMTPTTIIQAPAGMSCVNAFRALWIGANQYIPSDNVVFGVKEQISSERAVNTSSKVALLFNTLLGQGNLNLSVVGARFLGVDFTYFPSLDVTKYNQSYGPQAAQICLRDYDKIPSRERFDKNDSYTV